jgi:hypothetical protein
MKPEWCRVNITMSPVEERTLSTGVHSVADIQCTCCNTTLGWKYVRHSLSFQSCLRSGAYEVPSCARVDVHALPPCAPTCCSLCSAACARSYSVKKIHTYDTVCASVCSTCALMCATLFYRRLPTRRAKSTRRGCTSLSVLWSSRCAVHNIHVEYGAWHRRVDPF